MLFLQIINLKYTVSYCVALTLWRLIELLLWQRWAVKNLLGSDKRRHTGSQMWGNDREWRKVEKRGQTLSDGRGQVVSGLIASPLSGGPSGVNMWGDRRRAKGPRLLQAACSRFRIFESEPKFLKKHSKQRVVTIKTSPELVCIKKKSGEEMWMWWVWNKCVVCVLDYGNGRIPNGNVGGTLCAGSQTCVHVCVRRTVCYQTGINYIWGSESEVRQKVERKKKR